MRTSTKKHTLRVDGTEMDYIVFGKGQMPLVVLPGLSEGLNIIRAHERALALQFSAISDLFRVYIFRRKKVLAEGYTTRDMAADQLKVLRKLGIDEFCLLGISQGGMIAQQMAILNSTTIKKLILAVTSSRVNEVISSVITRWKEFALEGDYKSIVIDTCEMIYTEKTLKKYRLSYPIITRIGKPKTFTRFITQANACVTHNAYDMLDRIGCPTLIVGGEEDKVVTGKASYDMAEKIANSKLIMYEGLGHAAYDESKDFYGDVMSFLCDA